MTVNKQMIKNFFIMILLSILIVLGILVFSYIYEKYYLRKIDLAYKDLMNNENFSYLCVWSNFNENNPVRSEYTYLKKYDKVVFKMDYYIDGERDQSISMYLNDNITTYIERDGQKKFSIGGNSGFNIPAFYPTLDFFEMENKIEEASNSAKLEWIRKLLVFNFTTYAYHRTEDDNRYLIMHSPSMEYYFDSKTYLPVKSKSSSGEFSYEIRFDCVTDEEVTLPNLDDYIQEV